ncbi:MAG: hypothetical protein K2K49_00865, partial [Duncaniella sp.]|nr:hypothetical protein [Duncaniella sp.]
GGQPVTPAPEDEKRAEYPESTMWGIVPDQGLWLNHTDGVRIKNLRVIPATPDARPAIVATDSQNLIEE